MRRDLRKKDPVKELGPEQRIQGKKMKVNIKITKHKQLQYKTLNHITITHAELD